MGEQAGREVAIATVLEDDLAIGSLRGWEELGRGFEYEVHLFADDPNVDFDTVLGSNMTVRVVVNDDVTRYFNGFVESIVAIPNDAYVAEYKATIVPWFELLKRDVAFRIFQDKTVPDIIKSVFKIVGFSDYDMQLSGSYRSWTNCVQYGERTFDFVSRIMEQEGIYYYFKHEDGRHVMMLVDAAGAHSPCSPSNELPYRDDPEHALEPHVSNVSFRRTVQPSGYVVNDFNPETPVASLAATSRTSRSHAFGKFDVHAYPGEYEKSDEGETYAKVRLDELQSSYERCAASTNARDVAVGSTLSITEHSRDALNTEFLIVATNIVVTAPDYTTGSAGGWKTSGEIAIETDFDCIPSSQQFRAVRSTPRPLIRGPQTAIVVGPAGDDDIHVDEHGRIRVRFHWDREDTNKAAGDGETKDEERSCWIRVVQSLWAGEEWGMFGLPRRGQEVVVEFLEGDPDRPIVTGVVYNGVSKTPYKLPEDKTLTTFKSNSSPADKGGFNEIRFQDKQDEEQIFVQAQKNMDVRVNNDAFEAIKHDRHLVVEHDHKEHIKNDRHGTIDRDLVETIGRDHNLKIKGKQAIEITKAHSVTVKDDVIQVYEKNQSTEVTGDVYLKGDNICIEAATNVTIKVGQSYVAIESSGIKIGTTGDIVLEATGNIGLDATGNIDAAANMDFAANGSVNASLEAGMSASVQGGAMTEIKGGLVKIN